jgi:hypothetical protein
MNPSSLDIDLWLRRANRVRKSYSGGARFSGAKTDGYV